MLLTKIPQFLEKGIEICRTGVPMQGKENFTWTETEVEFLLLIMQEYKTRKTNKEVYKLEL